MVNPIRKLFCKLGKHCWHVTDYYYYGKHRYEKYCCCCPKREEITKEEYCESRRWWGE